MIRNFRIFQIRRCFGLPPNRSILIGFLLSRGLVVIMLKARQFDDPVEINSIYGCGGWRRGRDEYSKVERGEGVLLII